MQLSSKRILLMTLTFVALLFTVYICFYRLGSSYFENYDEAWYGEVTKNMMATGNFVVPYFNGAVLLDKPPFNFWLDVFSAKVFGLSELAIRFPSAIAGFLTIIGICIFTYKRYGLLPSIFAFSAIALNDIYIWRSRTGNLDALTTLLVTLSFFIILSKSSKRYVLLGVVFGLLYLQKLTLVLFPMSIFVIYEFLYCKKNWKFNLKNYLLLTLLTLTPGTLWIWSGTREVGNSFYQYFLFNSDQGVASVTINHANLNYIQSAYFSLQRYLAIPFVIGLGFAFSKPKNPFNLMLLLFSLSLLTLLSFTQKYNNWYLMPSIPFWAIVIALGTERIQHYCSRYINRQILSLVMLLPLLYVSAKTYIGHIVPIINTVPNVSEARTAKVLGKLSRKNDVALRLDWSYPVTIYYSNRVTKFYPEINENVYRITKEQKVKWVLGKKDQIRKYLVDAHGMEFTSISVGDEEILKRIK